ncbi:hypothetical protein CCR94_09940 [Rhodoblastus sphagnicola]|uniref:Nitrogen fixation protein n=2 Tax=Rhodoblastus sphagnicola TaxID=333368 RepID=A0A2S6N9B7_9HYPH|nr:hypothetical protein CCR94_09940 [Rhodoblastus sphagnicola]
MEDAVVFGVVSQGQWGPSVDFLEKTTPVTPDLIALTGDTPPTQVLRIAARCPEKACSHFDGANCLLVRRIVPALDRVGDGRFPCAIRGECRWFRQKDFEACRCCSQLATHYDNPDAVLREAARPRVFPSE